MKTFALAAALALTAVLGAERADAVSLDLAQVTPDPINVADQVVLELSTSSDFPEFFGFEVSLSYDADALQLDSIGLDGADFPFNTIPAVPVSPSGATTVNGIIGGTLFSFSGETDLLTLTFTALADGITDVIIATSGDQFLANGNVVVFEGSARASVTIGDPVQPIPLPATALLLLAGMGALSVLQVRRSA